MKISRVLSFVALVACSTNLQAANPDCTPCPIKCCPNDCDDVNKTFLMPRSHGVNLALEYTNGWQGLVHRHDKNKFGSNIQVAFFYEGSNDENRTGAYFSPKKKDCSIIDTCDSCPPCPRGNSFTFGARFGDNQTLTEDLNLRCFLHLPLESGSTDDQKTARMALKMDRQAYGFAINFHQDLDKVLEGLYFKVNIPITHVEHDINCCVEGFDLKDDSNNILVTKDEIKKRLEDYVSGRDISIKVEGGDPITLQEPLKCALIPCKGGCPTDCPTIDKSESESGVADIDVIIGYHFIRKEKFHASVNLGVTIPTGNSPNGKRIFEPMLGNGDHWGFGFGLTGDARIWGDQDQNLYYIGALNYRYLFDECECRKIGFCNKQWGQYRLLGKKGDRKLIPAANILLQKLDVTPGSQVDWITQLTYNNGGFAFDIGYNLYFREDEDIDFKNCDCVFEKETFAFPSKDYNPSSSEKFGDNPSDFEGGAASFLSDSDVDKSVAETPNQLSHKIYAGLSYVWKTWRTPILIGLGAHYEFGNGNETLDTWGVNVKGGVAF